jgi:hypothetical protein
MGFASSRMKFEPVLNRNALTRARSSIWKVTKKFRSSISFGQRGRALKTS